jgi:hypothetical protein
MDAELRVNRFPGFRFHVSRQPLTSAYLADDLSNLSARLCQSQDVSAGAVQVLLQLPIRRFPDVFLIASSPAPV